MIWQIVAILVLAAFYAVYVGKMLLQRKKGIQTDQIAKGRKKCKQYYTELVLKVATYSVVVAEVVCILCGTTMLPEEVRLVGIGLGILGDVIFATAVWTMKDSWRAGIAEQDETEMITGGIYSVSRNPAFVGFDLVYIGILLMFFHPVLLVFSVFAIVMLDLQIRQEERYLPSVFGENYETYRKKVCRYFGRRRVDKNE